jgi:hypothetical protein
MCIIKQQILTNLRLEFFKNLINPICRLKNYIPFISKKVFQYTN